MSNRNRIKKKLIIEGLFALLIAISPILFYSYKYLPVTSDNTWSILGITFSNNGYDDITVAFYFYLSKLIPLALLIIWFTTAKNWWYHIILIPISMYAFQLYSVFSEDASKIDENEILYLVAVCMVIIPIVYFIRVKLVDRYVHGIDLEAMEAELKILKEKQGLNSTLDAPIKDEFNGKETNTDNDQGIEQTVPTKGLNNIFHQVRHVLQSWF
ncbi:hypothetical protein [uncultured Kriegella sp.]|uniref:hypothetical protein n=1 Tax=uncultured Kriegella sp. TaxID=1798910 RepID=UPI0030D9476B|tara:strand:- start:189939 stop:190577 length:639 start_codon:yes stop_codon:yes gene_type:complete